MTEPTIRLRGGTYLVRPMAEADGPLVAAAFNRLSEASLRARFFTPVPRIHAGMVADLTRIDDQRIVLLAFDETGAVAAEARAVRHRGDPTSAEVAVTVLDAHQRQGLGSRLLRRLGAAARQQGITQLVGHVLHDNAAANGLLDGGGAERHLAEPGVAGFVIPLVPQTPQPQLAPAASAFGLAS